VGCSDNWAHVGGFFVGLFSGTAFLPYLTFGKWDKRRKFAAKIAALVLIIIGLVVGIILVYRETDASSCTWCQYVDWLVGRAHRHLAFTQVLTLVKSAWVSNFECFFIAIADILDSFNTD
jgi:hypothetical protein